MFTVTQTANVARRIIPKPTQEGMIPPRRRTSARDPIRSSETSRTTAKEDVVRGIARCALIRLSIQYVDLLKMHLQSLS
jgi:hypothetical protein